MADGSLIEEGANVKEMLCILSCLLVGLLLLASAVSLSQVYLVATKRDYTKYLISCI